MVLNLLLQCYVYTYRQMLLLALYQRHLHDGWQYIQRGSWCLKVLIIRGIWMLSTNQDSYTTLYKAQGMSWKRGWKESRRLTIGTSAVKCGLRAWQSQCSHDVITTVVVYDEATRAWARGAHPFPVELLASDRFQRREHNCPVLCPLRCPPCPLKKMTWVKLSSS